jgi:hypothetical protein
MSWTEDDERQLRRLLLIEKEWEQHANPAMPALQPPAPAETKEKSAKPRESKPAENEPPRGFIDKWCDKFAPGSDRPSGKALGKRSWMD